MNYPLIAELPTHMWAANWDWERRATDHYYDDHWLGTDASGTRWLVKMRGSDAAYREHAFGCFAQALGIACQSSVYLTLPEFCEPMLTAEDPEDTQLAILYYPEHGGIPCSDVCPLSDIYRDLESSTDPISTLENPGVAHLMDWARVEMLASICGANEPSEKLFTPDHTLVVIDNELMFSTGPVPLAECKWLWTTDHTPSHRGWNIAVELCRAIHSFSDRDLDTFARLPGRYRCKGRRRIRDRFSQIRAAAARFLSDPFTLHNT